MPQTKEIAPTITPADMQSAIVVDEQQFMDMLSEAKGANFVTFIAETTPKMRKTDNPYFGKIVKSAKIHGMINFHYDEGVKRRLAKEGKSVADFKQGKSWHQPVSRADGTLTPFCEHKKNGKKYLRFMHLQSMGHEYRDLSGTTVDKSKVEPFLSGSPSDYNNQGLDAPLRFLVYGIESIRFMRINGKMYLVKR